MVYKTKNGKNVPSLDVVEVVLVQFNSINNLYQQKPEVLYTFTKKKSYAYLLNVEPSSLVFLITYNTDFLQIIITFADQNSRPLEVDNVNLALVVIK